MPIKHKTQLGQKLGLTSLLIVLTFGSATAIASPKQSSSEQHQTQFQRLEQPLGLKLAVTAGGLALIALELWWFLGRRPSSAP